MPRSYTIIGSSTFKATGDQTFKTSGSVAIPGGDMDVIAVPFLPAGRINSLKVVQTGGSNCAFTVDLLCSDAPYVPGNQSTSTSPASPVSLYRILAPLAGSSGAAAEFYSDTGRAFRNVDGTVVEPQRFVYLVITPTGAAGTTDWDFSITGVDDGPGA